MKKVLVFLFAALLAIYLVFVFGVPRLVNSPSLINKLQDEINKKTDYKINHKNISLKSNYNLYSVLALDEFEILNKNKKRVLFLNNAVLSFSPLHIMPREVSINYLFFDKTNFDDKSKNKFELKNLPQININRADIILKKESILCLKNIKTRYENKQYRASFEGVIKYKKLKIGVELNSTPIFINKELFSKDFYNFSLKGTSLPIKEVKEVFLAYRKTVKPQEKNFIENFYDFKGTLDINLNFKPKDINGTVLVKNFSFKSVKFDVPFYYPKSTFYFKKSTISLKTKGTFGLKPLYSDYFYSDKTSRGTLVSNIDNEFAKKYLPKTKIKGKINLKVSYKIKNQTPEVEYFLNPNSNSAIYYKDTFYLDKSLFAKTLKKDKMLYLSYFSVVCGKGEFKKINSRFKLQYITLSAKKYAPIIKNGYYRGDLKYSAKDKELLGKADFFIKSYRYKKIKLKNFEIKSKATNNIINFHSSNIIFADGFIRAKGSYNIKNETFNIFFNLDDINSNKAANILYNLKDQIKGRASATMQLVKHKEDIKAHTDFYIKEGALTKLSSAEFLIKNSKFKLQKITNFNLSRAKNLNSTIIGHFDIKNEKIQNAEIFNQNRYLSIYLKGTYDIKKEDACICLFAKYNKSSLRGIKVFFIPLNLLTKFIFKKENTKELYKNEIAKIPPIEATKKQLEIILVSVLGNINSAKNLEIDFKRLR